VLPTLRAYGGLTVRETRGQMLETLGRLGSLEVKLARSAADVRRAQKLRYQVFYQEMSATADAARLFARRDVDSFDAICDHLVVLEQAPTRLIMRPYVVATCRLLRQTVAEHHGGFYTANEFDVGALVARHPSRRFLELGRSCVLPAYRTKRTVELLWRGIWAYVQRHSCDVLIGCASLDGTDPDRLALPLAFLHHFAAASQSWRTRALPERYMEMNRMPKEAIDPKAAIRQLPPLIKGYLRLGASIGEGAVIDRQFGTIDVLIVLPIAAIHARYIEHFGSSAIYHAA
jgi:putative hemolysin